MKFRNGDKVITDIQSTGERVVEGARKVMHSAAARIVKRAKLYAPIDTGDLIEAIQAKKRYVGARGRLAYEIIADGEVASGRNVSDYAAVVHEAYETQIAVNGPGRNTQAKMDANPGVFIGSKFLERAHEEEGERLRPRLIEAITTVIRGGTVATDNGEDIPSYDEEEDDE